MRTPDSDRGGLQQLVETQWVPIRIPEVEESDDGGDGHRFSDHDPELIQPTPFVLQVTDSESEVPALGARRAFLELEPGVAHPELHHSWDGLKVRGFAEKPSVPLSSGRQVADGNRHGGFDTVHLRRHGSPNTTLPYRPSSMGRHATLGGFARRTSWSGRGQLSRTFSGASAPARGRRGGRRRAYPAVDGALAPSKRATRAGGSIAAATRSTIGHPGGPASDRYYS